MATADGGVHDIVLLNETDDTGEISFRLPDGTYTFHLSKYGYASDNPEITVPGATSLLTLDPPGDLTLTFADAEGGPLHPVPNRVELTLAEQGGSREYLGRGDENGLLLQEIMPATYTYTITAFGYLPVTGTIDIHGGTNSMGPVSLAPTDRGTVTGHVVSGASPLADVSVTIVGTGLEALTDSSGDFSLSDLPYGTYPASLYKDGYQSEQAAFTLSAGALDIGTTDLPLIPPSSEGDPDLGNWTHAAWNRVDSFPGFLDAPSYKITTTYGAFNLQGSMIYSDKRGGRGFQQPHPADQRQEMVLLQCQHRVQSPGYRFFQSRYRRRDRRCCRSGGRFSGRPGRRLSGFVSAGRRGGRVWRANHRQGGPGRPV